MANACEARNAAVKVETKILLSARDHNDVLEMIETYQLAKPSPLTVEMVRRAVGNTKVLCMNMEGRTSVFGALLRAGIPQEALNEMFVERTVGPAKNSNLLSSLTSEAQQCSHLLYAWDGLRTLAPNVKRKFKGKQFEAPTAAQVAEAARRWIVRSGTKIV